VNQIFKVEVQ